MARRADRPNQVKAAVNPHRSINARIVPAPSVRNHLTSLVGTTIPTITGRPNRIVGIEGANVIVATQRSPEGEPVALSAVQTAADRVFDGEVVRIDPATVGFRSAFVGAVLQSMPGVEVLRNPPRASLRTPPADLNDVDAFLRTVGEPLEDPMTGHRFRIVATRPGGATYQRFNGTRQNTVSTEILQAILTEVSERADASESFTLGVDPRFWTDHGHFANAVIAGINYSLFRWPFNGLEPDATASLGRTLHAEAHLQKVAGPRRHTQRAEASNRLAFPTGQLTNW